MKIINENISMKSDDSNNLLCLLRHPPAPAAPPHALPALRALTRIFATHLVRNIAFSAAHAITCARFFS